MCLFTQLHPVARHVLAHRMFHSNTRTQLFLLGPQVLWRSHHRQGDSVKFSTCHLGMCRRDPLPQVWQWYITLLKPQFHGSPGKPRIPAVPLSEIPGKCDISQSHMHTVTEACTPGGWERGRNITCQAAHLVVTEQLNTVDSKSVERERWVLTHGGMNDGCIFSISVWWLSSVHHECSDIWCMYSCCHISSKTQYIHIFICIFTLWVLPKAHGLTLHFDFDFSPNFTGIVF